MKRKVLTAAGICIGILIFTEGTRYFVQNQKCQKQLFAMDTYMEFTAYGKNSEKAVDAAIEEVQKLDAMLSAENSKSEVYALNEQGNLQATDDLAELILRGKEIYQETDGLFDDTIYPVMKLWGFPTGNYHVPTAAEVQKKLALVDGNKVEIQTRDSDEKGRDSKEKAKFVTLGADQQIDFGGIAILHAYQSRISEYIAEKELSAMNVILKSQYDQYRNYQDSLDLIQMKYHDLKHQITALRAESDAEKRKKWIDAMEEEVSAFENMSKTGNQVLDTILAAKIFHCRKNHIQITCVADGKLLDFIHVTDLCSIFGNALDNAIEHVIMIPEAEKRLIHLTVSAKKSFVFIKIENYCEDKIQKNENDLITTTKADRQNHGFGLKSIRTAVEKYNGSVDFGVDQNWFELKILLPRVM